MKKYFAACYIVVAILSAVSLVVAQAPAPANAPKAGGKGRGPAGPTGPAPRMADGTPDLSGAWMGSGSNSGDISKGLKPGEQVVMLRGPKLS
jgi:hypothetical protein